MKSELPISLSIATLALLLSQTAALFFWGGQVQESIAVFKKKWDSQEKINDRIQLEIANHERMDRVMDENDLRKYIKIID